MTATLALIALALALALPWTRIRRQGGGPAMKHLILCHNGSCPCRHHLCLHLHDGGTKDKGHGNRQGPQANIVAKKRWDTTTPSAWSNKNKNKNKSTTMVVTSPPLRLQKATLVLPPPLPLHKQRQQRRQHGGSGGSSRPTENIILSAPFL
jgi:hypothetical protein